MTLVSGTRLGPYEVVELLGAGGMGEVYRARDTKLARDVALKTLPADVASDRDRLRRFEQEARSASALNHPNIVTIHDVDTSRGIAWIAMELVEGRTLRQLLAAGALPARRLLDVAAQLADGLARAHEAGIVHRDLKPENVMVRLDGFVKILDFGLAKLSFPGDEASDTSQLETVKDATKPGTLLGTVGYMSPEQASGRTADFRSDQFSFGVIVWEMASGRRAFQRATPAQTLAAVIEEDPEPLATAAPRTPPPVRWIVERCLSKDPDARYAATRDLARELATLRDHLSEASSAAEGAPAPAPPKGRPRRVAAAAAALAVVAAVAGVAYLAGRRSATAEIPRFQRLTFRRGTVRTARFASDEKTIVYGARWEGAPWEVFTTRVESPESRPLGFPGWFFLSLSAQGDLAMMRDPDAKHLLAQAPLGGGAPRPLLENVRAADWVPGAGGGLAVVRDRRRLEMPSGTPIYESRRQISQVRVSPSARHVAVLEYDDDGNPSILLVERAGRVVASSGPWRDASGLAWTARGEVLWFAASEVGSAMAIRAMDLEGRVRLVCGIPGSIEVHDISLSGRVLLSRESFATQLAGLFPGETLEKDLTWLDGSSVEDISADGRTVLFTEGGEGAGREDAVYVRGTDGSPAVRLGPGRAVALSPDGSWALADPEGPIGPSIVVTPTGPGETRKLALSPLFERESGASWFPDSRRFTVSGAERGRPARCWEVVAATARLRPLTPEGVHGEGGRCEVSRDGARLLVKDSRLGAARPEPVGLFSLAGGAISPLPGVHEGDEGWRFSEDSGSLLAHTHQRESATIFRLRIADGARETLHELAVRDRSGAGTPQPVVTPDGRWYAYSYWRLLSDLYVADGLR